VSRHILLDSSPLGLLSNPANAVDVVAITQWATACYAAGHRLYVPEVIDYELRRELLRAGKINGIAKLDSYKTSFRYLPLTTAAMLRAAELWALARKSGMPTGDPKKLDIDVILAAQALTLAVPASDVIVATSNAGHLSRFVTAANWTDIAP
jgi:predicted nucleic acid-binding protein